MLTAWGTAFVLIPPLLLWIDRDAAPSAAALRGHGRFMSIIADAVRRAPRAILVLAALLAVGAAVEVSRFDSSCLEYDFSKLRRVDTWKNGEGYWGRKMDTMLGRYLTPTVILGDNVEQIRAIDIQTKAAVEKGELKPFVARVLDADEVLPPDQQDHIAEAQKIKKLLTPKIRSLIDKEKLKKLDRILGGDHLKPVTVKDLPRTFTTGMREKDDSIGKSLLVYPKPGSDLWKADTMHRFVADLRGLAASDHADKVNPGRVAGPIPLSDDILGSIGRDAPIASVASLLGVIAVVLVVVRGWRATFHVLAALLLGVLWLAGAMMALHIKINFSNFIAFPITFGIGVDYSVNVMTRYLLDGERDIDKAIRSTGGAVALCSLTTIIGYSSLLLAKNRALFLFGLLAVLGEIVCLTAAIVVLPAWLTLRQQRLQHEPGRLAS